MKVTGFIKFLPLPLGTTDYSDAHYSVIGTSGIAALTMISMLKALLTTVCFYMGSGTLGYAVIDGYKKFQYREPSRLIFTRDRY